MDRGRSGGAASGRAWALLLALAGAAALWIGWIGFIASDDSLYHAGAIAWLTHPPFAGTDHWSTRFPVTLAFAGMIAAAGPGFLAFALTALLFHLLLVGATGAFAARVAGPRAGWIAALLTATLPVVVSHATTVSVDLAEGCALLLGAWLLGEAGTGRDGLWRGAAAGVLFGIAMLCRETSVLALAGLAPLFLRGRPVPRGALLAAGLACAAVLGAEAAYQGVLTGEPLRRYAIAFHHDEHIDRAANREGNFLLWPPVDPLLVLLVNDDFGLLFWLAGAAALARGWREAGTQRLAPLAAMACSSFVLVAVLSHKLVLNPRYFLLPALLAVVAVAAWLAREGARRRAAALAVLVTTNLLLLGLGNAHPRWGMEALVAAAAAYPGEIVAGARDDVRRARLPMVFAGAENIRRAPAPPGGLEVAPAAAAPRGTVLARYPSPPTRVGALVRAAGLERLVPAAIAPRLLSPSPAMVLVRRAPGG